MKLAITPLQRWTLREVAYGPGAPQIKGGQEGRRFRRFCRHLGIDVITEALNASQGRANGKQVASQVPSLFELDEDDRDRVLALSELERSPVEEDALGPLFDACEDWRAGREVVLPEAADFDASQESWKPVPEEPATE